MFINLQKIIKWSFFSDVVLFEIYKLSKQQATYYSMYMFVVLV